MRRRRRRRNAGRRRRATSPANWKRSAAAVSKGRVPLRFCASASVSLVSWSRTTGWTDRLERASCAAFPPPDRGAVHTEQLGQFFLTVAQGLATSCQPHDRSLPTPGPRLRCVRGYATRVPHGCRGHLRLRTISWVTSRIGVVRRRGEAMAAEGDGREYSKDSGPPAVDTGSRPRVLMTLRVSHDSGRTWGRVVEVLEQKERRLSENLVGFPPCSCPRCGAGVRTAR